MAALEPLNPAGIDFRHCETLEEYEECVRLEHAVWGEDIAIPSGMFVVAHHTGGQVIGAFHGGQMVGFALAFMANRAGEVYLHSHMAAVLPEYQNRGIGGQLKLMQRRDALGRGIKLIEWTFDPFELKNAHFNLVRLGAVARRFIVNCYGITGSPLHLGLPTDRLVAEWRLDSERVASAVEQKARPPHEGGRQIAIPANIAEIRAVDKTEALRVQERIREQFLEAFAAGWVATAIDRRGESKGYRLEQAASIPGLSLPEIPGGVTA